jgi:hypothetical protein
VPQIRPDFVPDNAHFSRQFSLMMSASSYRNHALGSLTISHMGRVTIGRVI